MGVDTFEGYEIARSPKAILFQSHYWDGALWVPVSQAEIEREEGGSLVIRIKDWLTKKRGIAEFTHYTEEEIRKANEL
jgi:hypothetical protein